MDEEELNNEETNEPEIEISQEHINKLKNLKFFKHMSDEEVKEYIKNKPKKEAPKPLFQPQQQQSTQVQPEIEYDEAEYQRRYRSYMKKYHKEYGVDMNDANDAQALESLVRLVIQNEVVDTTIRKMQNSRSFDTRALKNLGDFQRANSTSIAELQDKLGISRKARKDKQVDDIPQYIRQLQIKAKDFWDRSTLSVQCQKCKIELARYWLNFPDQVEMVHMEIECEKCHEKVVYSL